MQLPHQLLLSGIKIGASLSIAEYINWLRWLCPLDEELYKSHNDRRDRLTVKILEEHTQARQRTGQTKQHFVDALLTLKDQYDLSDDTVFGLLWVSIALTLSSCSFTIGTSNQTCGFLYLLKCHFKLFTSNWIWWNVAIWGFGEIWKMLILLSSSNWGNGGG